MKRKIRATRELFAGVVVLFMEMQITRFAEEALRRGSIKIRVRRSGILQQLTFRVKRVHAGNVEYVELFTERIVDTSELIRIANEVKLPIEAPNATAFPDGTSATDYSFLASKFNIPPS